jgi:hypothetical protein
MLHGLGVWGRRRDGSLSYGMRDGAGGWVEVPREYWPDVPASFAPGGQPSESGPAASSTPDGSGPEPVRQFLRESGRRGGLERARSYACRIPRCRVRFGRLYQCEPNDVEASPVAASHEVRPWLREYASRGGRGRARRYPPETLRSWAAMGGYAKAAKSKGASLPGPWV